MRSKTFELRDRGTFIPILAVRLQPDNEGDRYLLARAGFGLTPEEQARYVHLVEIAGGAGKCSCDPYDWDRSRTKQVAHAHIIEHFDALESGSVVDVEFILGLTGEPKRSERETAP